MPNQEDSDKTIQINQKENKGRSTQNNSGSMDENLQKSDTLGKRMSNQEDSDKTVQVDKDENKGKSTQNKTGSMDDSPQKSDTPGKRMPNQEDSDKTVQVNQDENKGKSTQNKIGTMDENPQKSDKPEKGLPSQNDPEIQVPEENNTKTNREKSQICTKDDTFHKRSKEKNRNEVTEKDTKVLKKETWTQTDNHHKAEEEILKDDSKRDVFNLQKEIQILEAKLDELATERDISKSRLGRMMSAQLKNNNPGIADLSDPIRPTKIAEKYGQLYDDEWTDGFQHLNHAGSSEKESIEVLLENLKECFAFCEEQEKVQGAKVVTALVSFESKQPSNNAARVPKSPDNLNTTAKITLNELRRQTGILSKETVINEYFTANQSKLDEKLTPYIEKCLELCWYMVLQSPPVFLELEQSDSIKKGSPFNKDLFRHYSRTGKKLGFVVWPPLYLHKGGPLLAKGVAQPEG